ncbi:MAG: methyltransferase domain-containing protein [Chitinophagaceae bacterium]
MDLKELALGIDPQTHWYYQSKMIPLERYFLSLQNQKVNHLVDIGAGSGFFSVSLHEKYKQYAQKVDLVDIGYSEPEMMATANKPIQKMHVIQKDTHSSLLIMMDVLEHIEDDSAFLDSIQKQCIGKNNFFISVPAFKSIWSGHDVYLEHYRRYTLKTLRQVLEKNGFRPTRMYYLYGSLFPMVWLKRKLMDQNQNNPKSDMKPLPKGLNSFLKAYASTEMKFTRMNSIFGLSCVAEGELIV